MRRGGVRLGKERYGRELETVDRVLATVPLRVFVATAWEARLGRVRHRMARANVAAMELETVSYPMQTVHQIT